MSIHSIRRRLRRETWWAIHLFMYLALALAFAHEIALGPSFVGHPLTRLVWSVALGLDRRVVLVYRFGLPLFRTFRHRLEVVEVRPEGPGTVSVICRGRHLDRLAVSGGQFFEWRFLTRGMWWQAHPFSLSARPRPPFLRLTVKGVGDYLLGRGPAAARHPRRRRGPLRGLHDPRPPSHEGRPHRRRHRRHRRPLPARGPASGLRSGRDPARVDSRGAGPRIRGGRARPHRKGRVHELVGSRSEVRMDRLAELVPDLRQRDVYVSGPKSFVDRGRGNRSRASGSRRTPSTSRCTRCERTTDRPQAGLRTAPGRRARAEVQKGSGGRCGQRRRLRGVLALHRAASLRSSAVLRYPRRRPRSTTSPTDDESSVCRPLRRRRRSRTAVGTNEQYGYGTLAVKVTVRAGRITDVSVANLQTAEQYSQSLAQQVIPMLRNEVLSAQSAHINGISGATYTSEAYAYSVQSALDHLGAK